MKRAIMTKVALLMALIMMLVAGCASEKEEPKTEKDTLTVVISQDPDGFDPNANTNFAPHQVKSQIYETLVRLDENNEVQPCLAESWEYEDDQTLIFKLRKGVKFHNGEELKASDVIFSYKRAFEDKTAGYVNLTNMDIDKCEAVDDYTVKLVTKGPYSMQLNLLENPLVSIFSQKAYEDASGDFTEPVGTGPYKLKEYFPGDRVEMTAFEDYWGKDEPKIKNLVFRVITESASRAIAAETGEADIVYDIASTDIERLEKAENVNMVREISANTRYVSINTEAKPYNEPKVREALRYAIDRPSAVKVAWGDFGKTANGLVNDGIVGASKDLSEFLVERDVQKAKELLKEAGYPDGFKTSILCSNADQESMSFCEAIQSQLAEVGITLEIKAQEPTAWVEDSLGGRGELSIYGFTASTGEAGKILVRFLSDANEFGMYHWNSPEFDEIMAKALQTIDDDERNKLFDEAQKMVMKAGIAIPIWQKELAIATSKNVEGFQCSVAYEAHILKDVSFK